MQKSLFVVGILTFLFAFIYGCQSESTIKTAQYTVNGQKIYITHCQNCHGEKGEGLGNLYPPLTDIAFLKKNRDILPCIIKNGSSRKLEVAGKQFNTAMPATHLSDIDIAYVLTYIYTRLNTEKQAMELKEVQTALGRCMD